MNPQLQGHTMYHQQRNFALLAEDQTEPQEFSFDLGRNAGVVRNRKGYFARLLNALHEARRLQAARVIRQYRHLVAEGHDFEATNKILERGTSSEVT
jgi:hypothetical protein